MNLDPIDSLRLMLYDRIHLLCCILSLIAVFLFLGVIVLGIALNKLLDRLPVP